MRDLLYLSESKMQDLVPQLPRKVLKRLGMEAGVNIGVLSLSVTLSPDERTNQIAVLDNVIDMIESDRQPRARTAPDLRAGDWIRFQEAFRYGTTPPETEHPVPTGDLFFLNAVAGGTFSLCGSHSHFKGAGYAMPDEISVPAAVVLPELVADPAAPQGNAPADGLALAGHARVLTVHEDFLLATPLYAEFAPAQR